MSGDDPASSARLTDAVREEVGAWLRVAVEDGRVAEACLSMEPPSSGNAAYHCQQAAEKSMKALLVAAGAHFRKIHDLDELATALAPHYRELGPLIDACRPFTVWATEYRYPPADEAPPPTIGELRAALTAVRRLFDAVEKVAPAEGSNS